ncbi:MAG: hypothetical protein CL607_06340 [Anaerolineaceae bacterium]|nr:hypothetical protein [Anaerolineaceae bacterium]
MPKLRMLRGPEPGQEFDLDEETIQIGRGRKNEIIIHDNEVSREHCRLVRVLDDYELHDLNSTNGTYVNGQPIEARGWLLNQRQIIELGDSITLEYVPSEDVSISGNTAPIGEEEKLFYLVIKRPPPYKPRITPLRGKSLTIGRATDNDISINVLEMSRHHMRLFSKDGGIIAEDLNSTNGTMLNGEKLTHQEKLENGDVLQIGDSLTMVFTSDPADASKPPDRLLSRIITEDAKTEQLSTRQPQQDKRRTTSTINATSPLGMLAADANQSVLKHGLEPNQLVDHVMMVYARTEWKPRASKVFTYLQNRNLNVWTDQYLLPSSQDWQVAFDQAISECPVLLVILTRHSIKEDHVKRAIRYFQSKEKLVVLMQYGDISQKPIIISNMDTIHFDEKYPAHAYEQIIAAIEHKSSIKARASEQAAPPVATTDTKPQVKSTAPKSDVEEATKPESAADNAAADVQPPSDVSSAKAMPSAASPQPTAQEKPSPAKKKDTSLENTVQAFMPPISTEEDNKIPTESNAREKGLEMLKSKDKAERPTDETESVDKQASADSEKPTPPVNLMSSTSKLPHRPEADDLDDDAAAHNTAALDEASADQDVSDDELDIEELLKGVRSEPDSSQPDSSRPTSPKRPTHSDTSRPAKPTSDDDDGATQSGDE